MQRVSSLYSKGFISAEKVMESYSELVVRANELIAAKQPDALKAKNDVDNLFITSGVANCDNIVELFTPRFEANPDDEDLASTIVSLLSQAGCTSEPLFLETVEALYEKDPDNYVYIKNLYMLYAAKGDQDNAIKMLERAIASEQSNDLEDANMLITLANYYMQLNDLSKAALTARTAIDKSSEVAGRANFIIGLVWGSVKCSGDEIESRANYWLQ